MPCEFLVAQALFTLSPCEGLRVKSACATRQSIGIALCESDSRNSCKISCKGDARPPRSAEKARNFLCRVMTEFQNEYAAGFEKQCRLRDQWAVEFCARFATEERNFRFMLANFARQCPLFPAADVGRVADDKVERR